jgi:hypothetical protein
MFGITSLVMEAMIHSLFVTGDPVNVAPLS